MTSLSCLLAVSIPAGLILSRIVFTTMSRMLRQIQVDPERHIDCSDLNQLLNRRPQSEYIPNIPVNDSHSIAVFQASRVKTIQTECQWLTSLFSPDIESCIMAPPRTTAYHCLKTMLVALWIHARPAQCGLLGENPLTSLPDMAGHPFDGPLVYT